MARFDLVMAFNIVFPYKEGFCRYCGKPIPEKSRFTVWCGPSCKNAAAICLNWDAARMAVIKRDGYRCQMCGTHVYLFDPALVKLYSLEDQAKYADYFACCSGERKAEIHHVIPVDELSDVAWGSVKDIQDKAMRSHWFWKLGIMLELDVNNLATLCQKPCHDVIHNRKNRLKRVAKKNDEVWKKYEVAEVGRVG